MYHGLWILQGRTAGVMQKRDNSSKSQSIAQAIVPVAAKVGAAGGVLSRKISGRNRVVRLSANTVKPPCRPVLPISAADNLTVGGDWQVGSRKHYSQARMPRGFVGVTRTQVGTASV